MRSGPGRPKRSGKRNPPGSKIARRFIEHQGLKWKGEVFHGGELTDASDKRAGRPKGWARATYEGAT